MIQLRACLVALVLVWTTSVRAIAGEAFFPLMAWNSVPTDRPTLQKMRDCGLTVAGFATPNQLGMCQEVGLKAIVSDPRASGYDWKSVDKAVARKNIESLISEVGKHPAVYGYYLRDEPGAELFEGLATVSALIRELAPGKWPYINLFPNYASPQQLGSANYAEHLQKFLDVCKPVQLSYDHYALMDDGSLRNGYWQNLESMRAAAKRADVPVWNIVLAVAHFNYREPTAADMRFQVYSSLAYGARGIAYFTYFAPQIGNYRAAPVDQFNNVTPAWHALQNVNLQVANLAPTLLRLKSDRVYHFGQVPDGCTGPAQETLIKAMSSPDFMCGDFTDEVGSRYVFVVNKDFSKSHHCAPQFRTAAKRVQIVSPYTGQLTEFAGEQQWLAAGQGSLLKVE